MFVIDYTGGGAPFGTTLDDYPEPYRSELLAELEAGNQPEPPALQEVANPFAPWFAGSADELHRMLVTQLPDRSIANPFEPSMLLAHHHETDPETTLTTALLLLTDIRWKGGVGRLAGWMTGSGILDGEELDLLARTFLRAGMVLYWKLPDHWPTIEVLLDEDRLGRNTEVTRRMGRWWPPGRCFLRCDAGQRGILPAPSHQLGGDLLAGEGTAQQARGGGHGGASGCHLPPATRYSGPVDGEGGQLAGSVRPQDGLPNARMGRLRQRLPPSFPRYPLRRNRRFESRTTRRIERHTICINAMVKVCVHG